MFPPTLLSCSIPFLRALQQNRAESRLLYLLHKASQFLLFVALFRHDTILKISSWYFINCLRYKLLKIDSPFLEFGPCKGIRISEWGRFLQFEIEIFEIQNPEKFARGIQNPRLWNRNTAQRIRNATKDWLESRIQVPLTKPGIQYLESRIHGVESRIQECLIPLHGAI